MTRKGTVFLLLLLFLLASGCAALPDKPAYKNGYPDLRGRHIVAYVSARDEVGRTLLELFKERTGCTYEYLELPTQEAVARLEAQKNNPVADVFIGGTCDAHTILKKHNLSERYIPKNAAQIAARYKDPEGYWTGFGVSPLAIAVNPKLWHETFPKRPLPQTLDELADPALKGKICLPDPATSGTAYALLAAVLQRRGNVAGLALLGKLKTNAGELTVNGFAPAQKVATGEYLAGINFLSDQSLMRAAGFQLVSFVPEGIGWNVDAVSKLKNAPNGDVGLYFVDFCTSAPIEQLLARISCSGTVGINTNNEQLQMQRAFADYDFAKAADMHERNLQFWNCL